MDIVLAVDFGNPAFTIPGEQMINVLSLQRDRRVVPS
ncbi:hypothetical protein F4827_006506 [Paraburkholderia bannensis]|uniref:Uncharacterized protein n=1 Tax=Paraburkholderia bannensis TaxID=765414 RepID=A0A7W9U618_9BURK|nr:hypothetical protein [Paraburkholderia sp. WP4_3_2]MBB6106630.1 hypothetical protein [Paraburkholderia bannensis]